MLPLVHHYAVVLSMIAVLWMAALVSPGPDFLLITRMSITQGRAAAMRSALGVATGIAAWGVAGFFGIHALFVASPWLYIALKLGGGVYLIVLGLRLFLASWRPTALPPHRVRSDDPDRAFHLGLLTNIANPKAPLFVSSLFAATLPSNPPTPLGVIAVVMMFALALGWYVLVARCLTIKRVADVFTRSRRWIDRVAGLAFMTYGTRLMLARSS